MIRSLLIFFLFYLLFLNQAFANLSNAILLKVDNHIITSYELKNKIMSALILSGTDINQQNIDKLKKQSLESLINNKLKLLETSKYKVETNNNQLNKYLNSISNNNLDELKSKFNEHDLDFNLFTKEIDTQLKWQKFILTKYSKKITIDENVINNEVKSIAQNLKTIEEFNLSEIEILRSNNKSDRDLISDVLDKVNLIGFEKTSFNNSISNTSSDNGKLGWINSKSLSEEIFKKINKLNIGEISEPIIRQDSILILKLNDRRKIDKEKVDLVKLKKDIVNKKRNDLFNLYSNSHLSKLKNSSFIEYNK